MDILLLGGTGFLGRELSRHLAGSGHAVTCLARGSQPVVAGATLIRADRDQPDALAPATQRVWDAVIDLTSQPLHAARAARELSARHWVYVSSVSVYTDFSHPGQTETAETHTPLATDLLEDMSQYGSAKVACENFYLQVDHPVTIIRPGLIGGHGDVTGRSGYYAWRCAHPTGADVLVPDATQPTAILDVEDLAAWTTYCLEVSVSGTFNATGDPTTLAEVYRHCRDLTGERADIRVVDDTTLLTAGIQPWAGPRSLPLWLPDPSMRFMATVDSRRARENGLRPRPLRDTLAAALRYEEQRHEEQRPAPRQAGLTDDEEVALRRALRSLPLTPQGIS